MIVRAAKGSVLGLMDLGWPRSIYSLRMSSPYESPTGFQPTPRRRIWPFILSGCAVVGRILFAACGGLIYFGLRQVTGEGEVAVEVDRLFQDIAEGRAAEFYRDRGSDELKRVTSEQDFVSFADTVNEKLGRLRSKTMSGFSINNRNLTNYVDAVYDCQFERGKASVKTSFKQENGRWLLLGYHVDSPELLKGNVREKCPHCGKPYAAGAKFCPHCGKELANGN
jgi:hypothetical protein